MAGLLKLAANHILRLESNIVELWIDIEMKICFTYPSLTFSVLLPLCVCSSNKRSTVDGKNGKVDSLQNNSSTRRS